MAIEIVDRPEPLSEESQRSRGPDSEPLLVESHASRVLRHELERYCSGKINGRSFLIAGHRGAGKTTLVAKALMDVRRKADSGASMLRPLFIPLHGPSLFPHRPLLEEGEKADEKSTAQIALEQITLGLHRAVSHEFADAFRARADQLAWLRRTPNQALAHLQYTRSNRSQPTEGPEGADAEHSDTLPTEAELHHLIDALPHERELHEIAAQFEAELYEGPTPERLREFWQRMHALSGGVLFPGGFAPLVSGISGAPTPPTPPGLFPNLVQVHAQGVRELIALSGVLEAYRRISGEYKKSEGDKQQQQRTSEQTTGLEAATKELAAPIASLVTGGLALTGLAIAGASPLNTALGGVLTALGSSLVFKTTSTRKRERTISREYQFIYDLSVATLDRVLPILIERLREAGLAPVFVVDELDKVTELSRRIISMVHHLKKLVAENAFFCFLTNRSYFEEMLAQGSGRPYPVEYTYYTHRLFVVFSPEDFEVYLRQRIPEPDPLGKMTATLVTAPDPEATVEATARAVLRWALRHRSQLHVVDLQREIAALRDDQGRVRTAPELIASARRNLIDVTFQVGIELTLAQRDVDQVLMDRPEFRRMVHDALYYLSRQWLDGAEAIDLSDSGRDRFRTYLESRTGREEERAQHPTAADADQRPSVSEKDLDFLLDQVGVQADFLCDRPSIEAIIGDTSGKTRDWRNERLTSWNEDRKKRSLPEIEADVQDVLLVGDRSSLLIRDQQRTGHFTFRHRVAGSARPAAPVRPAPSAQEPPTGKAAPTEPQAPRSAGPLPPPAVPPPQAAPVPQPTPVPGEAWEDQAKFIEGIANALRTLSLEGQNYRPDATALINTITLDALATRFRILAPSPTASVVLAAIANLRDARSRGTPHAGYADDAFQVDQFYQMLVRNGEPIARALVVGAAIGQASGESTPDARIAAGLNIIAKAMQFASKREDDVRRSLENVSAMIRVVHGDDFEEPLFNFQDDWPSVEQFLERTRRALKSVAQFVPFQPKDVVRNAWISAQARLTNWVKQQEVLDPDLYELLAAAMRRGPTELLEFDPRQMTLHQWTRLLVRARVGLPNAEDQWLTSGVWLTLYAWHALGFRATSDEHVRAFAEWAGFPSIFGVRYSTQPTPELSQLHVLVHEQGLLRAQPGLMEIPTTTMVLLRRTNSPMTASWRPVPGLAILLVTAEELTQLTNPGSPPLGSLLLPQTTEGVCAVEMEPELATHLYPWHFPLIKTLLPTGVVVWAYPTDRGRDMKVPNVVAPSDPKQLVDEALRARVPIPS